MLPHDLLYRPKQGFATSLTTLFRDRMPEVRSRLLGPAMLDSGLFDGAAIGRLLDEHAATSDHAGPIWLLLTFEGFLIHAAEQVEPRRQAA